MYIIYACYVLRSERAMNFWLSDGCQQSVHVVLDRLDFHDLVVVSEELVANFPAWRVGFLSVDLVLLEREINAVRLLVHL